MKIKLQPMNLEFYIIITQLTSFDKYSPTLLNRPSNNQNSTLTDLHIIFLGGGFTTS